MQDMTPAKDKTWKVLMTYIEDIPFYSVARKRFENQPLHAGNVEKAYNGKSFTDIKEAVRLCDELNRKEGKDGDNSKSE